MTQARERYAVLLRAVNVGGRNKIPMAALRDLLENLGFSSVATVGASGNAILESDKTPREVRARIERAIPATFRLDSQTIMVLVLTRKQLASVVANKPKGFGERPDKYHSDAIFLIDIDSAAAMNVFDPKDGVDRIWAGQGVIYSQRLSAKRTQSRLSKIVGTAAYRSMTIRSWSTTVKLARKLDGTGSHGTHRQAERP